MLSDLLKKLGVQFLYYMLPMQNLKSVLIHGILSHIRAEEFNPTSIANKSVQSNRSRISLLCPLISGHRNLLDYVNLYFGKHTPMQYVIDFPPERLLFLRIDPVGVMSLPGVWFTDGNAARTYDDGRKRRTHFFKSTQLRELEWTLDWKTIHSQRRSYDENSWKDKELKGKKMSEVLVPERVPIGFIDSIVCCDSDALAQAQSIVTSARLERNDDSETCKALARLEQFIIVEQSYYK